jgi:hypothetical protein
MPPSCFCCRVFTGEARFEAACGKAASPDGGTYGPPQECNITIGKNGFEGQQNRETAQLGRCSLAERMERDEMQAYTLPRAAGEPPPPLSSQLHRRGYSPR